MLYIRSLHNFVFEVKTTTSCIVQPAENFWK